MPQSRHRQDGFTLVELLVVVAIIGVLAAIALPAFLGQTRGASDAKAKSDIANAQRALETYWSEHDSYAATRADLVAVEGAVSQALNLTVSGNGSGYRVTADSRRGSTFVLEKRASGVERSCTPAGIGGCSSDGSWVAG